MTFHQTWTELDKTHSAIALSDEPRYKFCAVHGACNEPGGETIFDTASITFKKRFMFMSGINDEADLDPFRKALDWRGYAQKVTTPYLVLAGGADQRRRLPAVTNGSSPETIPGRVDQGSSRRRAVPQGAVIY